MSVDPITVEIIRCALKAAANEMSAVLKKTAYNMMIYEVQDYCVAVLDHEGRTMSQNEGALPIFLADLGVAVQDGIEVYGKDNIHPRRCVSGQPSGDLRPAFEQHGGVHAVFLGRRVVSFLAVRAHWIDVGGGSTGFGSSNTRDVYEEGLQVRSVKIYKRGKPNTEVLRLIEDNIRFPESSLGDLRAQIACCRTGEERLEQICRKYGGARFQEYIVLALRNRGYSVFFDRDDLPPGQEYDDQIEAAIRSCTAMVFFITPNSFAAGRYQASELEVARRRWPSPHRHVLPVYLLPPLLR